MCTHIRVKEKDFQLKEQQFIRDWLKLFDLYFKTRRNLFLGKRNLIKAQSTQRESLHEMVSVRWKASLTYWCSAAENRVRWLLYAPFFAIFKCAFIINFSWFNLFQLLSQFSTHKKSEFKLFFYVQTQFSLKFIYLRKLGWCGEKSIGLEVLCKRVYVLVWVVQCGLNWN